MSSTGTGRTVGRYCLVLFFVLVLGSTVAWPEAAVWAATGKKAADSYFVKRREASEASSEEKSSSPVVESLRPRALDSARFLALHLGGFFDDKAYAWGRGRNLRDVGGMTTGVTYRVGEWTQSMDLNVRADFTSYRLSEGRPVRMSILPLVTFPDVRSGFPLYFGAGVGVGVYLDNISDESALTLDYQLVAGARLMELFDSLGFFVEFGMKNHFHLLTDGQFNGVFAAGGATFNF